VLIDLGNAERQIRGADGHSLEGGITKKWLNNQDSRPDDVVGKWSQTEDPTTKS